MSFFDEYESNFPPGVVTLIDDTAKMVIEDCADILNFIPNVKENRPLLFVNGNTNPRAEKQFSRTGSGKRKPNKAALAESEEFLAGVLMDEYVKTLPEVLVQTEEPRFYCRRIPDEAFLILLMEEHPAIDDYLDTLASTGVKTKELLDAIRGNYIDSLTYAPDKKIDRNVVFVNGVSHSVKWALQHCDDPMGNEAVWLFSTILSHKTLPTKPLYRYQDASLTQDRLHRAQSAWSLRDRSIPPPSEPLV